jgi:nicotinate-nucleotide adenylyltransferase
MQKKAPQKDETQDTGQRSTGKASSPQDRPKQKVKRADEWKALGPHRSNCGPQTSRLGLFGGTFNPIHLGHLRAGIEIGEAFSLDRLLFIPTAVPPHKKTDDLVSFAQRWKMIQLAITGTPFFRASDVEKKREGKSYSIRTLRFFKEKYGKKVELFFIIGMDAFWEINTWKEYRNLFTLSHFIVIDRPGYRRGRLREFLRQEISPEIRYYPKEGRFLHPGGHSIYLFPVPLLDISSTRIRSLRRENRSSRYLVPEEVEKYMIRKNLYAF